MKTESYTCDVCKGALEGVDSSHVEVPMQIIFTTEQDEGRSSDHYFEMKKLDLCDTCKDKALSGKYIFAQGAMGHNTYHFQ